MKLGVLAALAMMTAAGTWAGDGATAISSGFGLALIGLRRWDAAWSRVRLLEPLRAIGVRSYSIYLVHLPVVVVLSAFLADLGFTTYTARALMMVPLATVAAVAAGLAFYRLVETRFLELPTWGTSASLTVRPMLARRPSGLTFAEAVSGLVHLPSMG
jgi:peptidoglycan/LPS O-acetylase OafA/YrhL